MYYNLQGSKMVGGAVVAAVVVARQPQFKLFSSFQVCHHNHSLEEANEYEYLKNILFQYMMGRESTTLSKVLSAVLKFSPDQQKEIALREEHRQSFLTTFGFRPV